MCAQLTQFVLCHTYLLKFRVCSDIPTLLVYTRGTEEVKSVSGLHNIVIVKAQIKVSSYLAQYLVFLTLNNALYTLLSGRPVQSNTILVLWEAPML